MAVAEQQADELAEDDAHRDFHAAIVALAGNRQLDLMYEPIMLKLQRPMAVNLRAEAAELGPGEGIRRHQELLTALETNDPGRRSRRAGAARQPALPAARPRRGPPGSCGHVLSVRTFPDVAHC